MDESRAIRLLREAILGNKESLGELFLMHRPMIKGYINKFIEQRYLPVSLAEDLLQDIYEAACESFEYYDPTVRNGDMGGLLQTIAARVCASNANLKENRRKEIPMSDLDGSEDSDDGDWTVTDGMVATAWMAENYQGYVESPPPLQKATSPNRPKLYKTPPRTKKVRSRRLPEDELQRREKVRQEWAAGEGLPVG